MYAVFEDGSRQYRVSEGDVVRVDYREDEVGTELEFTRVLLYQNGDEICRTSTRSDRLEVRPVAPPLPAWGSGAAHPGPSFSRRIDPQTVRCAPSFRTNREIP